ncbi:MAG: S9 family peptidase [Synechococcus sp. SB0676_bin_10]|uniref:S9 family peptidase n=1 Tax=Synechococcus sp. SB0676_bin_10 TaxID=2604869 RepID=A0A6B1F459_9SYNE|nr:S9 family peptidase [Synechococcus sp. SB0676_bin_10]
MVLDPAQPLPASAVVGTVPNWKEPWLVGQRLFWLEQRPWEQGRTTLMTQADGQRRELTPGNWNLRTSLHGFGGAPVAFGHRHAVVVNQTRTGPALWLLNLHGLTPLRRLCQPDVVAMGDGCLHEQGRFWIGIWEQEGRDVLTRVCLHTGASRSLRAEADFCSSPSLSPDGRHLLWLEWDLPAMPWQRSRLWLAQLGEDGGLRDPQCLAGDDGAAESVFQPQWLPDGGVVMASDRNGYWNLHHLAPDHLNSPQPPWRPLLPMAADFGLPQWVAGMSTTAVWEKGLVAACCRHGCWGLGCLQWSSSHTPTPHWRVLKLPFTEISNLRADGRRAVALAAGPRQPSGLLEVDLVGGHWRHTCAGIGAGANPLGTAPISTPEAFWFPGHGGRRTHGWLYRPVASAGLPPLLVRCHGGPTAMARPCFSLETQFWISRGWAVLDVNYGGSSGFGRAYRQRLDGAWGVVDVEDCTAGVRAVAAAGWADPERVAVSGGSAGGFTALGCLCSSNLFRVGACRYGVTDLAALTQDTHRFERGYAESLVGPWPAAGQRYRDRSPLHRVRHGQGPVVLFQGLKDQVVLPEQAERMAAALRQRDVTVEVHVYPEEGHGFRDGRVQQEVLLCTEAFFRKHL